MTSAVSPSLNTLPPCDRSIVLPRHAMMDDPLNPAKIANITDSQLKTAAISLNLRQRFRNKLVFLHF